MVPIVNKVWIEEMGEKYDYKKREIDLENRIFAAIKKLGPSPSFLTKDILMMIVDWKASRASGHANKNEEQFIMDVTRASFSATNEELRIGVLTLMKGVGFRMASTILHFRFPDSYTIMDWRAWNSLKALDRIQGEIEDTFECWKKYNEVCREIAKQNNVTLRELDKALWTYKGGAVQ